MVGLSWSSLLVLLSVLVLVFPGLGRFWVCLVVLRGLRKGRDFLLLLPLLRTCRDGKPQPAVMANLNLSKPGLNLSRYNIAAQLGTGEEQTGAPVNEDRQLL